MRAIDIELLRAMAPGGRTALIEAIAPLLAAWLAPAGIDTPLRQAHFLGQAAFESWYFTRLEEDLDYTAPRIAFLRDRLKDRADALAGKPEALGNAAYAFVNGNGDEASGDGWRFRGRGLFQLTGRANYAMAGYLDRPDEVAMPEGAVKSAIGFWTARHANAAADADDTACVTRLVNGGQEGVAARESLKRRALALLGA